MDKLIHDPAFKAKTEQAIELCDKVVKEYISEVLKMEFADTLDHTAGFTLMKNNQKYVLEFAIVDKDYMLDLSDMSDNARKQMANILQSMYGSLLLANGLITINAGIKDQVSIQGDPLNSTFFLKGYEDHPRRIGYNLEVYIPDHKRPRKKAGKVEEAREEDHDHL